MTRIGKGAAEGGRKKDRTQEESGVWGGGGGGGGVGGWLNRIILLSKDNLIGCNREQKKRLPQMNTSLPQCRDADDREGKLSTGPLPLGKVER